MKQQVDDDVKIGVIQEVPAGEVTDCCARMVVVAKKNNLRRTVDYQEINKSCKIEIRHTSAPFIVYTYKTVVDAYSGFCQMELDEES